MSKKRDCAFQYAYQKLFKLELIERTKLTYNEAKELWNEYLPGYIKQYEDGNEPQMAIWTDMAGEFDFGKSKHELDYRDEMEVKHGRLVVIKREEVAEL